MPGRVDFRPQPRGIIRISIGDIELRQGGGEVLVGVRRSAGPPLWCPPRSSVLLFGPPDIGVPFLLWPPGAESTTSLRPRGVLLTCSLRVEETSSSRSFRASGLIKKQKARLSAVHRAGSYAQLSKFEWIAAAQERTGHTGHCAVNSSAEDEAAAGRYLLPPKPNLFLCCEGKRAPLTEMETSCCVDPTTTRPGNPEVPATTDIPMSATIAPSGFFLSAACARRSQSMYLFMNGSRTFPSTSSILRRLN